MHGPVLALLLACGSAGDRIDRAPSDAARYLRDLAAPASDVRAAAGLWLARHLVASDLDVVLDAIRRDDAETNRRLVEALSDDDRHLALAVALAATSDAPVARLGREAITEMIARWQGGQERSAVKAEALMPMLAKRSDEPVALEVGGQVTMFDVALDQLARFADAAPALVLDPGFVDAHPARAAQRTLVGTFDRVLAELVQAQGARCEGFGFDDDAGGGRSGSGDARPWIRVFAPDARETSMSGRDHLVEWCVMVRDPSGSERRRAAARALASTGWPAALRWFETLWSGAQDPAALEGLLLAARRGQVAPALMNIGVQRELYARLVRACGAGAPADLSLAQDIARALGAAGPSGPAGEDLAALALEGWNLAPATELWLRLVIVEEQRSSSPLVASAVDAIVSSTDARRVGAALRFQALRARAASPRAGVTLVVPGARELLEWAVANDRSSEAVRVLRASRTQPADELAQPRSDASPAFAAAALEWWFAADQRRTTAIHVAAWVSVPTERPLDELGERGRAFVREGERARWEECLAIAAHDSAAAREALERLAILSGTASPEVRSKYIDRAGAAPLVERIDLLCSASLVRGERGRDARAALLAAMRGPARVEDVVDALDLAWSQLAAARDDDDERSFVKEVRGVVRDAPAALRARLRADIWPGKPYAEPRAARELDRRLDQAGL